MTFISPRLSREIDYPPLNGPWGVKHGKIISHISICYQHIVFHGHLQKYSLVNFNWVFLESILKISQFKNISVTELNTYLQVFSPKWSTINTTVKHFYPLKCKYRNQTHFSLTPPPPILNALHSTGMPIDNCWYNVLGNYIHKPIIIRSLYTTHPFFSYMPVV